MKHLIPSCILVLSLICVNNLKAQFTISSDGIAPMAATGSCKAASVGVYSGQANQAGLAYAESMALYASGQTRFIGTNIKTLDFGFVLPLAKKGTFGLNIQQFGTDGYKENKIGLSYGRKLFKNLSIGGQVDYVNANNIEQGSQSILTFELGILADLLPNLKLGLHAFNPVRVKLNEDDALPAIVELGFNYTVGPKFDLLGSLEKDLERDPRVKAGIVYRPNQSFSVRTGMRTAPFDFGLGLGYNIKNALSLDFGTNYHQDLGFSPSLAITYQFKKS